MKIHTFPADGYMSIETTPQELRSIANRLERGDVNVEQDIPGAILVGFKLDEAVAAKLPHASRMEGEIAP